MTTPIVRVEGITKTFGGTVKALDNVTLEFEPGTGYAYSNVGYALLGLVVEQVTGQSYEAFLREELLLPAGLAETGYVLLGRPSGTPRLSRLHLRTTRRSRHPYL